MQNKFDNMIVHLKTLPNSELGFSPPFLFETAKTFNVPGRIIRELFLGNSKKVSPGKYAVAAAVVAEKTVKTPKVPKTVKTTDKSSEEALLARKNLIAKIAKRHMAERNLVKELYVKPNTSVCDTNEFDILEELEQLQKISIRL